MMKTASNVKRWRFKAKPRVVEALPEFGLIVRWILEMEDELDRPLRFADIRRYRKGGQHKGMADTLHEVNRTYGYEFARMRLKAAEARAGQGAAGGKGSARRNGAPQPRGCGLSVTPIDTSAAATCPCGQEHPAVPDPALPINDQRRAWKLYWHRMAVLHPPDKFEVGADCYANWWQIEAKERTETTEREYIFHSWMDDLRISKIKESLCPACLKRATPYMIYDADDLQEQPA